MKAPSKDLKFVLSLGAFIVFLIAIFAIIELKKDKTSTQSKQQKQTNSATLDAFNNEKKNTLISKFISWHEENSHIRANFYFKNNTDDEVKIVNIVCYGYDNDDNNLEKYEKEIIVDLFPSEYKNIRDEKIGITTPFLTKMACSVNGWN